MGWRRDGNSAKGRAARFVVRIVLQQILRPKFAGDAGENLLKVVYPFGNESSSAGRGGKLLHGVLRASADYVKPQSFAAGIDRIKNDIGGLNFAQDFFLCFLMTVLQDGFL